MQVNTTPRATRFAGPPKSARIQMAIISPGADSLLVHGKSGHERLLTARGSARTCSVEQHVSVALDVAGGMGGQ